MVDSAVATVAAVAGVAWLIVAIAVHTLVAVAAAVTVLLIGAVSLGVTTSQRQRSRHYVNVASAAESAQRAVLRPLPERLGPLELGVVYLAAAQDARVGGDLYEVVSTPFGIRLIIGDVRGKGLGAVEIASDVLGTFREIAHEVHTLAELARRLDAVLTRKFGEFEEFVTACLAEVDPVAGRLEIYNCGHPPPMLISDRAVTVLEVPAPAPPLGLLALADTSGAGRRLPFRHNDALLLYTDGVTEARDKQRVFYPLDKRLAELADGAELKLLDRLREDLLRYAGAPLHDDAAMLLIRSASD
ncbi:MAG: PP2C family protein-serine/threonine phosphatase [Streptosporangiaceae bacterium]|jgi:serine phosphatase RsbU (regulator of sigma subunit)